ncbi:MAG: nucleotidyltransferase family protein [Clostridia bacterium]|nr:nucleotidyltransferase family protein [Clostridia bacterium]
MQVNVILLSGGRPFGDAPCKALALLRGRPMISYVVDALRVSGVVNRILAVGPATELQAALNDDTIEYIEQGQSMMENLGLGLTRLPEDELAMTCSADVPLLTGESVRDIYRAGEKSGAEFVYTIISRQDIEAAYPGAKRTYVKLRDGQFTGGNLTMVTPRAFFKNRELTDALASARKNPLKLARLLGMGTLLGAATGFTSVARIVKRGEKIIRVPVLAYRSPFACTGQDVDRPEDMAFTEQFLPEVTA